MQRRPTRSQLCHAATSIIPAERNGRAPVADIGRGTGSEELSVARQSAIHVDARGERDWLVREDGGRDLGHYPTRREAETVGYKLARKRGVELFLEDGRGKIQRSRPRRGLFARLFGR